jgi:YesN/AraC family two-component response regulator
MIKVLLVDDQTIVTEGRTYAVGKRTRVGCAK